MPARLTSYRLLMTSDAVGGVWRYSLDAARALSNSGVTTSLVTMGPLPSEQQRLEAAAIEGLTLIETQLPLDWLTDNPEEMARAAEGVAAFAREGDADLVQLNGTPLAGLASFPAPVVVVHHSCLATWWASVKQGPLPDSWLWKWENTRLHLHAAASVATPTRAFAEATAATYRLAALPRVIPNGRPTPAPSDPRPPIQALLTAGRLWDEGKDIPTLGRAAAAVDAPIFAAGPLASPTGERVDYDGLQLLGELADPALRDWMARRPIFVSSSLYEPFGLAVLEAAQAGCALLLTDIPTFREIWADAAIFVAPRDEAGFARAARQLLSDPATRARYGEAARARAELYTAPAWSQALLEWHRQTLRQHRIAQESAA